MSKVLSKYYFKPSFLWLFLLFSPLFNPAFNDDDPKAVRKTYKEITHTDITKYPDIYSTEILIFGISFSMSISDALEKIEDNQFVYFSIDPFNNNRYYLYDYEQLNGKNIPLAYFIWDQNGVVLLEVVFYQGFKKHMVGDAKKLLSLDIINKNSDIVKNFMGYPVKKETTLDIPSIGLKTFCYYYPNHNFKIFRNITDQTSSISFSICRELLFQ